MWKVRVQRVKGEAVGGSFDAEGSNDGTSKREGVENFWEAYSEENFDLVALNHHNNQQENRKG